MKGNMQSGAVRWIWRIIMALSFAVFAFHQILIGHYSRHNIALTAAAAFVCAVLFVAETETENCEYIKNHICVSGIIFILGFFIVYQEFITKSGQYRENAALFFPVDLFRFRWYLLSLFSIVYFGIWLYRKVRALLQNICSSLDAVDKKMYIGFTAVLFAAVFFAYASNPMWYLQYDHVYSIDSGWCYNGILPQADYYDIRHPILGEAAFPLWAVIHSLLSFCAPDNLQGMLCAVCIQWINIQFLLVTGLILKILTKSRFVFLLYMFSFPTLLFSLSLEKYQFCMSAVVLYVYMMCMDAEGTTGTLILSAGVMPTSGFIGILELFTGRPLVLKIKRIIKISATGAAAMVCLGRGHLLNPLELYAELMAVKNNFGSGTLTITERVVSVLNMVHSSFTALSSSEASGKYLWTSVTSGISFLCVLIILFMMIGAVRGWKIQFVRICVLWTLFSAVLFVVLNWSPHESPLFALLFSWAFIPLFQQGLDWVIEKFRVERTAVYAAVIGVMAVINAAALLDIQRFLLLF